MEVDLKYFKSLLGSQYQSDGHLSPLLYTQEAIDLLRKWYDSVPHPFKETHLLSFLRRCTNLSDAEILNIFDVLDWDQSGTNHLSPNFLINLDNLSYFGSL